MAAYTKMIVTTPSAEFYNLLKANFTAAQGYQLVWTRNILEAGTNLTKHMRNILILDLQVHPASFPFVKQLIETHQLLIICTATNATPELLKLGIKEFVLRPRQLSDGKGVVNALRPKVTRFTQLSTVNTPTDLKNMVDVNNVIIGIASSTGGTEALLTVLKDLPADTPPVLSVQHMTNGFTAPFAVRLNNLCQMEVKEASSFEYLKTGLVLIAPAGYHMALVKRNSKLAVECYVGQRLNGVMPAADVLFDSMASIMKKNAIGVILTGMGKDGAKGLLNMHRLGAKTIGQDEKTCVVYGMPKAAYDLGAIDVQRPLHEIAKEIIRFQKLM